MFKKSNGIRFKNANKGVVLNFIYDNNNKLINSGKNGDIIKINTKIIAIYLAKRSK